MYFSRSAGAVSVNGIEKVKKLTVRVVDYYGIAD